MQTQTCPAPAKPLSSTGRSASGGRAPHLPHARSARNAGAVRIRGRSRANGPRVGAAPQLNPVAELDGAGVLTWQYVYGSKPNVPDYAIRVADGARYRVVSDQLGSVVLVVNVDDAGDVLFAGRYSAFGEQEVVAGSAEAVPFGFAGGRYDADTGLVRFGARDYDPETGRWTGKEPLRFDGAMNFFVYVDGDPINWVDPSGRQTIGPADPPPRSAKERVQDVLRGWGVTRHWCIGGSVIGGVSCMAICSLLVPAKSQVSLGACLAACAGGAAAGGGYLCKDLDDAGSCDAPTSDEAEID